MKWKKPENLSTKNSIPISSLVYAVNTLIKSTHTNISLDFIRIPNLSKDYDKDWATNGLLEKAANLLIDWGKKQGIKGLTIELIQSPGKTPLIFAEVAPTLSGAETILFYGHLDKQPHMLPWREGLSPIDPVEEDGKLYGRGGADDGYAWFAAILAVKTLQHFKIPHGKIIIIIESDEETGRFLLTIYL